MKAGVRSWGHPGTAPRLRFTRLVRLLAHLLAGAPAIPLLGALDTSLPMPDDLTSQRERARGRQYPSAMPQLHITDMGARKPLGFSQGMHGLPLDNTRTHVLLYQAGETAKLAGETRSPHKPPNGCLVLRAPGPAGDKQGATGVRCGAARPVDGPLETALGLGPRAVKRRSRRRKQLRGSRSESPACKRGSLNWADLDEADVRSAKVTDAQLQAVVSGKNVKRAP